MASRSVWESLDDAELDEETDDDDDDGWCCLKKAGGRKKSSGKPPSKLKPGRLRLGMGATGVIGDLDTGTAAADAATADLAPADG